MDPKPDEMTPPDEPKGIDVFDVPNAGVLDGAPKLAAVFKVPKAAEFEGEEPNAVDPNEEGLGGF